MKKLFIETYGCQMNVADSEVVASVMQMAGYEPCEDIKDADAVFLNTCSVRDNAEQKIYNRLDTLDAERRKGHKMIIGVLGCMAERVKEDLLQNHHADLVAGPDSYLSLPDLVAQAETGHKAINIELSTSETYRDIVPQRLHGAKIGGYVSIMRGCNNFCHYCIVPYTRGRERSRDLESILREVRDLRDRGYKEVTLLGQNVNSYIIRNEELGMRNDFPALLRAVALEAPEMRIRFTTSHPKDMSDETLRVIAEMPNVCKHIHLPVQSGSDRILKEMNRHYTVAQYMDLVNYAKEKIPGVTFSSDIIVGFPGETEEDFQATLDLIQQVKYMQLFTFIYSKRTGTIAAKLPDPATHAEKAARMDRLLKLQDSIAFPMIAAMAGQTVKVLVEAAGRTPGTLNGRLDNNLVVEFPAEESLIGQYANVRLTGSRAALLVGELAE